MTGYRGTVEFFSAFDFDGDAVVVWSVVFDAPFAEHGSIAKQLNAGVAEAVEELERELIGHLIPSL